MKLFDKYFQPYAEYCLRTTFSEDELKETLAKECPATSDVLSWKAIKAAFGLAAEGCTVPESVCGFTRYQAERVACRRFFCLDTANIPEKTVKFQIFQNFFKIGLEIFREPFIM